MPFLKEVLIPRLLVHTGIGGTCRGQFSVQDKRYKTSLGFIPLELPNKMGFIVPAFITGAAFLLTKKDTFLYRQTSVYTEAGITFGYKYLPCTILPHNFGINVQIQKFLSVVVGFSATPPFVDYSQSIGFAIRLFARFYAINSANWKLWFEFGSRLTWFTDYISESTGQDDRLGKHLNGTTKCGIVASVKWRKPMQLLAGVRCLPVSNTNIRGENRNPLHDSNRVTGAPYLGVFKQ